MNKSIDVEELKKVQLDILDSVHKFCVKNNIKYFLTYGTLIGSIRHKGYIPWDDDIDICMPRPDYNRFMKEFNKSHNNLKFVSYELDPEYPYTFGKVMNIKTRLVEHSALKYPLGVNIDVFPIDGVDLRKRILKKQILLRNILNIKTIKYSVNRPAYKSFILFLGKLIFMAVPIKYLVKKMIENSCKYSYEESSNVTCVAMGVKLNKPVSKKYFSEGILKEFEGREFFVPIGYDEYLKSIYGDYMKLPPEDKRDSHHVFDAYHRES